MTPSQPSHKITAHQLKAGDYIRLDEGFTCHDGGLAKVYKNGMGRLYFACSSGRHYLEGQEDSKGFLIGITEIVKGPKPS